LVAEKTKIMRLCHRLNPKSKKLCFPLVSISAIEQSIAKSLEINRCSQHKDLTNYTKKKRKTRTIGHRSEKKKKTISPHFIENPRTINSDKGQKQTSQTPLMR